MPVQASIHDRGTFLKVRLALLQGVSGNLMAGIELPKTVPNCDLKKSTQPMSMVMTAPEAPPGLPSPGLQAPGFSFSNEAPVFVPQRTKDVEAASVPVGSTVSGMQQVGGGRVAGRWWNEVADAAGGTTRWEVAGQVAGGRVAGRRWLVHEYGMVYGKASIILDWTLRWSSPDRNYFPVGSVPDLKGVVIRSCPQHMTIDVGMSSHFIHVEFESLQTLPEKRPALAGFKKPSHSQKLKMSGNSWWRCATNKSCEECGDGSGHGPGLIGNGNHAAGVSGCQPSGAPSRVEFSRSSHVRLCFASAEFAKLNLASLQDALRSPNVMTAPSQGFEDGSNKHGVNESDHQEQPSQEEGAHGSDTGEANEGSRTKGQIEATWNEVNMQVAPRSSNVMAATSQGLEGYSDKHGGQAGDDCAPYNVLVDAYDLGGCDSGEPVASAANRVTFEEEPSQEESTNGCAEAKGNGESFTEARTDENEIGTGQVRQHGKQKGYRQRQRANKYWEQVRQLFPED